MSAPKKRRNCIRGAFSVLNSRVKRRRRCTFFLTKFLGTSSGCSEDRSLHTRCRMNFTSNKHQKGVKPQRIYGMHEAVDLEDVFCFEDPQVGFMPGNSVLPFTESHSDIYMKPENYFQAPMESIGKETAAFTSKSVESYELSHKSKAAAEWLKAEQSKWLWMPECPSPMETEPSGYVGFLENSIMAALPPESGGNLCEERANISSSRMHW